MSRLDWVPGFFRFVGEVLSPALPFPPDNPNPPPVPVRKRVLHLRSSQQFSKKELLIVQCSDPMMWYADQIGCRVPIIGEDSLYFLSREPAGYSNIIKKTDAKIVPAALPCA